MKRTTLLIFLALVIAAVPSSALAARRGDAANDTGSNKMDIVRLKYTRPLMEQARLKIATKNQWGCMFLEKGKGNSLRWLFDGGNDGDNDMIGRFFCEAGKLFFHIRSTKDGPIVSDTYNATRPNRRSAQVQITLNYPQLDGQRLGLIAKAKDTSVCGKPCTDRAPNKGRWIVDR